MNKKDLMSMPRLKTSMAKSELYAAGVSKEQFTESSSGFGIKMGRLYSSYTFDIY